MRRGVAVAVLMAMLILTGCGGKESKSGASKSGSAGQTAPGSGTSTQGSGTSTQGSGSAAAATGQGALADVKLDSLLTITTAPDLLKVVKTIAFEAGSPSTGTSTYRMESVGREIIGGAATEHLVITVSAQGREVKYEIFVTAEGKTLRSVVAGQVVEGMAAEASGNAALMGMLSPFMMVQTTTLLDALKSTAAASGVSYATERRTLSGRSVTVHKFTHKVPTGSTTYEIGEMGSVQFLIGAEVEANGTKVSTLKVTELVLR